MTGKVVAITGANAGIGKETAVALARMGAMVAMTSRDAGRGAEALADVRARSGSSDVELLSLDLADLSSVRDFAVNHLGHFYLTSLLLDRLKASAYRSFDAYTKSKLADVYFTRELARRLAGTGVTVNAAHPGYVASRFGRDSDVYFEPLLQLGAKLIAITPEAGARTSVCLATSPDVEGVTGGYYAKCKPAKISKNAADDVAARRLWDASDALLAAALEP